MLVKDGQDRLPTNEEHDTILKAFPTALSVGILLPTIFVRFQTFFLKSPGHWPLLV